MMESMEQRIVEAAISCIEEYGIGSLTIRKIASKADVNTAAINYYFRSKEQLIDRVIEVTLRNAFDWSDLAHTDTLAPREQLFAILDHLTAGAQQYPHITRAHFYETLINGNYQTRAVKELNRFLNELYEKFKQKGCAMQEQELRFGIAQAFMAGLFSVGMMPNICGEFLHVDLTEDAQRKAFLWRSAERSIDA